MISLNNKIVAVALGATLLASAMVTPAPAQAADSKSWKYGAIGLGVLGAYALSKGKNVEGAAALGGALYAYKKGKSDRKEELRNNRFDFDSRFEDSRFENRRFNNRRFENRRSENRRDNKWRNNDWRKDDWRDKDWRKNDVDDCDDD